MKQIFLVTLMALPLQLFALKVCKKTNVTYMDSGVNATAYDLEHHQLDIYYPKDTLTKKGVIVFFHGGSWNSGDKHTYRFMAKNLVRKGFVAVVVNYRMSPEVQYEAMAEDGAHAVDWVRRNINHYGGDDQRITLAGHSAGGHLVALIYLQTLKKLGLNNPVRKVLLIDPFGLDMFDYFHEYKNDYARGLFRVFTDNPTTWKAASPMYSIDTPVHAPFLILTGSKTYPAIIKSSQQFHQGILDSKGISDYQVIRGKKHIPMIIQFFFRHNKAYDRILPFLRAE